MKNFEVYYVPRWRLVVMALLVIMAMVVLLSRLYDVQIRDDREVSEKIRKQTTVSERLSPARGSILDRNGIPLAENKASFDVDFYLDELVRNYKRQHRGVLPKIGVRRKQGKKMVDRDEPNIGEIVKDAADQLSAVLGLQVDLNPKELQEHYYQTPNIPFQYRTNIDFETLARFSEHNLGVPGIDIAVRPIRYYNYGAMAAHILGYVGKPAEQDSVSPDGHEYETVGRGGIESVFDRQLQGTPGGRISRINYKGYIVDEQSYSPPTVGNSLYLTLDARIQYICEQVMRSAGRGAAVVMDPNNGDILAMVSVPSFDPNAFIPKIDPAKWKEWNTDKTAPLLNRAVSNYTPGSIFKLLVASAALKSGALTPSTVLDCPPSILIGNHVFHDHSGLPNGAGPITIHDAIRLSCNVFFYQAGIKTGIQAIDQMGELVGFGSKTGVPIDGEQSGVLPGPEWIKNHYTGIRWTTAHTANASIGQGYVQVTPLQMAVLTSAMANGGTVYVPRLTTGVTNMAGESVVSVPTLIRSQLGLAPSDMAAIRDAMWDVVKNGTGQHTVPLEGVNIAGKSGSAQHTSMINGQRMKDTTTWFVSFAPYEKPRYTVVVMVEGGVAGGATAGPLVHQIYEQIFNMEKSGINPQLAYLAPAVGSFNGVTEYVPPPSELVGTPGAPGTTSPTTATTTPAGTTTTTDPTAAALPTETVNENDNGAMTPTTVRRTGNRGTAH